MTLLQTIKVIPNFFSIKYVQNTGAAWGIFSDQTMLLTIIGAIFLIVLNRYLAKEFKFTKFSMIGYGFLIGGMIGNLVDRILHGYVIDFLSFRIFSYDFPVFNVADILIVVGVFFLVVDLIRGEINERSCRKRRS